MEKNWKILKSKEVFAHPRLHVVEDDVLLPNGVETKYLKFKNDENCATVICKREDGKILLEREYSHPPEKWIYQFPGGHVPEGEDMEEGANRELMEEVDYRANTMEMLGEYLINNRRSDGMMHVYLATDLVEQSQVGDIEEDIRIFWFSEEEIDALIKNGEIINCHVLAAWSLYKLYKNKV